MNDFVDVFNALKEQPIETVIILTALVCFIYWFFKIHPKNKEANAKVLTEAVETINGLKNLTEKYSIQVQEAIEGLFTIMTSNANFQQEQYKDILHKIEIIGNTFNEKFNISTKETHDLEKEVHSLNLDIKAENKEKARLLQELNIAMAELRIIMDQNKPKQ